MSGLDIVEAIAPGVPDGHSFVRDRIYVRGRYLSSLVRVQHASSSLLFFLSNVTLLLFRRTEAVLRFSYILVPCTRVRLPAFASSHSVPAASTRCPSTNVRTHRNTPFSSARPVRPVLDTIVGSTQSIPPGYSLQGVQVTIQRHDRAGEYHLLRAGSLMRRRF